MELAFIYQWINFGLFLGLLIYFLRTPIKDFLSDRAEGLKQKLETVSRWRLAVETEFKGWRKKLAEATEEIENFKKEMMREAEIERKRLIKKGAHFAEKIREEAKRSSDQELKKAKFLLRKKTVALALVKAREKITQSIEVEDQKRLVLWGIEHLKGSFHEESGAR